MKDKTCPCGEVFTSRKNGALYCSLVCRKRARKVTHDRCNHERYSAPKTGKLKCVVCACWYHRVATHARQRHSLSAIEYKRLAGLDKIKGVTSDISKARSSMAVRRHDEIIQGLRRSGKKTRFKQGQELGRYERSPQTVTRLKEHIKRISKPKEPRP